MYKNIFIIFIIFFIIIFVLFIAVNYALTPKNLSKDSAIILTCFVGGDKKKREMYEKTIDHWLSRTNFPLYVVDSSGHSFSSKNSRLKSTAFIQKEYVVNQTGGPTIVERNSLWHILEKFPELNNYKWLFKITGKYFLRDFERCYKTISRDSDIILQSTHSETLQNCELFGMKPLLFKEFLNNITTKSMEEHLLEFIKYLVHITRLNPLKIENPVARSNGTVLYYL